MVMYREKASVLYIICLFSCAGFDGPKNLFGYRFTNACMENFTCIAWTQIASQHVNDGVVKAHISCVNLTLIKRQARVKAYERREIAIKSS